MATLGYLIKGKLWPPANVTSSFENKTVIVTGGNRGLGFEAALKYVELGAHTVVLGVRSVEKGQRAKDRIEEKTQRLNVVQVWELDMERYQSVDEFARRVDRDLDRLDIAVLNAAVLAPNYELSPEGWEQTLQVDTISTALLSILLIPKLKAAWTESSPAHLEIVSSIAHMDAKPDPSPNPSRLHDQSSAENFHGSQEQYCLSKLFTMWITRELAQQCVRPDGTPQVIINDTCPGGCSSEGVLDYFSRGFVGSITFPIISFLLFRTAEQGARTIVSASLLGKESHGKWWVSDQFAETNPSLTSKIGKEMQRAMWLEMVEVLVKQVPRVQSIVANFK